MLDSYDGYRAILKRCNRKTADSAHSFLYRIPNLVFFAAESFRHAPSVKIANQEGDNEEAAIVNWQIRSAAREESE